ncbi:hypothetical protein RN001_002624 [Aquatica leii]|uniref:RanBD1 domain-containing protein n=1 Tax=Aquatica leii TaxID=1421715 RepID=A0AAN7QNM0_9COLE|nr:hypothetical protein RN001_002624 [Aquatica leii]
MAGKRTATSELNHTNWEEEEETEDAGTFAKAAEDVMKNRVIKIAKRRNPIGSLASCDEEKKSTFANFGGFGKPSSTATSSAFSFLSNLNKTEEQPKSNGLNDTSIKTVKQISSAATKPEKLPVVKEADIENSGKPKEYYAKIKGLNQSVSKWIQNHVDKNPFLNLTPIFRDYEKYLEDIESLQVHSTSTKLKENKSEVSVPSASSFTFTKSKDVVPEPSQFTFGSNSANSNKFSFGKTETNTGFTFGSSTITKPFSLANVAQPETITQENKDEEEEDLPPKAEFTPVVEEGHIYSIRCKVFVKKNDNFGDRGVGNLFLKPVPDSDKIQLIVRADTNLGHLTCNFILSKSIPMQRLGKKDVMLVCLPTPEHKPPPVPVLFRVKSSEDADELLKILEKHKK